MPDYRLRVATLGDLTRIYSDAEWAHLNLSDHVHAGLPAPGTTIDRTPLEHPDDPGVGVPYIRAVVQGDTEDLTSGDLYWTTFAQFAVGLTSELETHLLQRVLTAISLLPGSWNDPLTYPIVFEVGAGGIMKWIRSTFSGDLGGGVEHFQFHIDLGNPGSDPDIDEAAALALAEQIAGLFTTDGVMMRAAMSPDCVFIEVGCVQMEATVATDKFGAGGNAAQKYATQWSMYPSGARPAGTEIGGSLPYEVATCVTLETDYRGPSGRGRIYLPPPGAGGMGTQGRFIVDHRNNSLTGTAAFLTSLAENTDWKPIVVSPRKLVLNTITSVGVGSVPDSQRRRRRSQDEARIFTPVPA